ncbi:hypothetical protein ASE86_12680 [Sphingomonas sp. Leaf33]|uniref:hypothetical protein n=1 Tax=Sphingomonas sp. Leaf33 TaxID=1736215 RepID=UPI0006F98291|nr:hypothetical protein [Sphingomonas sp. Leaf33]KQN19346.1 hypothetical protein ASE86_12680 [Sphingomonas sp. Leaf33]
MATTAAAVVAKARRDVMSHFLSRDAVSPEKAVPYQPDRRIRRRMFEQFQRAGVVKAGESGWYVDVPVWDEYSRRRRRRAGALIGGSIAIGAALALIFA